MKKKLMKLSALSLCLSTMLPALAFADTHSSSANILQYGPNGGITFSVYATTTSVLTYSSSGSLYNFNNSDSSIRSSDSYGLSSCGDTLAVRNTTTFNSSSVTLSQNSSYIVAPGTSVIGKNSGSSWTSAQFAPFSISVNNEGYVQPAGNKCFGGGTVTDSWTDSH
ncbi:hypothetical protein [Paenibacillus qinlingensis]|uniref:Uncharacterized protein n=1 Tax=Paenibacillus qinlingensis TaxID=1837343 RepID=A0ABU1NTY1_9BACL|nr:hypothetical protein [Paenibacillus qinlingensis]MDR6550936.1 hypothetical protein [Paenibacillus qinlingensis]